MSVAADTQLVYDFAEGSKDMRELLGGKGANVAEMTRVLGAERVPAGFTITTEACVAYMEAGGELPEGLEEQADAALERLEEHTSKTLGDADDPLLVSVRSGARESMPGMLDTVLNLGLNDESVEGLGGDRFAWDSYRRFVQMFGNVCRGIPGERFEELIEKRKEKAGVTEDTELSVEDLKALTEEFKEAYEGEFPQDPRDQLIEAIRAVFDSWTGPRAVEYRRINRIPDTWGTAVNVQQMVFGNRGDKSCSGVAFSRDEITGAPEPSGDFLVNAQGEDVVSGVRTPRDISEMKELMPEAHAELMEILRTLEQHYKDMQDTEFTVEEGTLYMLQTRNAKRPAQAAVRFAVDAVEEGLLEKDDALMTIEAARLDALLHPAFARDADFETLTEGVGASPGAASGEIVFTADDAVAAGEDGRDVILVRPFTEAERRARLPCGEGHPHEQGRQGEPRGAGCARDGKALRGGRGRARDRPETEEAARRRHRALGGRPHRDRRQHGASSPPTRCRSRIPRISGDFETVLEWADELRSLGVRTNADTAEDATKAREFGAEGIGLCRSEHIFLGTDNQAVMQAMIMAESDEERGEALDKLLELQRGHFKDLFEAMHGLPVTIRLLDPPLHEFIPNAEELAKEVERALIEESDELEELESTLKRVHELTETNPMLGTRGVRLAILHPEIYEMQVRAIVQAALALDEQPELEVMIPLVAYEQELDLMRELVDRVIEEEKAGDLKLLLGTMIELPSACFVADRIAERADFFSFGTNDLTQTAIGFSRDDVGGAMLARYMEKKIVERSPFETIDAPGVGWLVRLAAWVGREAKPDLKLGICGEHGGDPDSIELFQTAGLDYVSCSPYRVPVARVAAAQSAIKAFSNP